MGDPLAGERAKLDHHISFGVQASVPGQAIHKVAPVPPGRRHPRLAGERDREATRRMLTGHAQSAPPVRRAEDRQAGQRQAVRIDLRAGQDAAEPVVVTRAVGRDHVRPCAQQQALDHALVDHADVAVSTSGRSASSAAASR